MVERIRILLESRQLTPTQFADLIGVARPIVSHILSGRNKPSLEVVQRILAAMPNLAMPWLLTGSGPMLAAASPLTDGTVPVAVTPATLVPATSTVAPIPEQADLSRPAANQQNSPVSREAVVSLPPADAPFGKHIGKVAEHVARVSRLAPSKPAAAPKRFVAKAVAVNKSGQTDEFEAREPVEPAPEPVIAVTVPAGAATASALFEAPEPAPGRPVASVSGPAGSETPTANPAPAGVLAQALLTGAEKSIRRIVIFYRDGSFADYRPEEGGAS